MTTENEKQKTFRLLKGEEKKWIVGVDYYPNCTENFSMVFPSQQMRVYFTVMATTSQQAEARATAIYESEFGEESRPIAQSSIEDTTALTVYESDEIKLKKEFM